ncbi:MAG: hypothetical protein IIC84_02405 [Chloroflexi bacterium]|nr:hypothetical protein [Chloroflexota bacterium]
MKKSRGILNLEASDLHCEIPLYKGILLPMVMIQGWFNDQDKCFELFFEDLTNEERTTTFISKDTLDAVKSKYRLLWENGQFKQVAKEDKGVHKLLGQLSYGGSINNGFGYWISSVFDAVQEIGSLEELLKSLDTVEDAHYKFKPWFYRTKKVRNLNAADAARILAMYEEAIEDARSRP